MFVLVLWLNPPRTTSILPEYCVRPLGKNRTEAKWEGRWYRASVLKRSENRRLLEDLEVTTDGEIMEKEEVVTGTPILERRKLERKEKNMISALQESAVRNLNREILEEGSLFDENLSAEENENDDEKHSNYTDDDVGTSVNKKKGTSPATSVISLNDEAPRRDDPLVPTKTNGPDDFPNVTERNIEFLESLLHPENASFIEKFVNYAKKQRSIDEAETGTYSRTSREQMEIGRNSNIWLPSFEVESIKRRFKRHPAKMMRALLIELLGEDKLSKLSISGKGAHVSDGIPSRMLEGIKSFVNENTPRALRLTDSETHKKIASFCNYLRASSKKAREPMERQNEQTTSKKRPAGDTTTTVPKKMNKN